MQLIEIPRKSRVLKRVQFGCLRDSYSLNVTRGCSFCCVYCYARGYPEAPDKDQIFLYSNLPHKVVQELDSPRRKLDVQQVSFNTASDCFQNHPRILQIAYQTMQAFLERGVGISFLTKGRVPESFLKLFCQYPRQISAAVGLVSASEKYREIFEPGAASIQDRLNNIRRLKQSGLRVQVRIDPIIPFITDGQESMDELFGALAARNVHLASLSYLHLRPRILEQLRRELPPTEFKLLQGCFPTQTWVQVGTATRSKLVQKSLRQKGYQRWERTAKQYGLRTLVCACKNPDLPAQICASRPGSRRKMQYKYQERQLNLLQDLS